MPPILTEEEYPYQNETYKIIGAAMSVHSELGSGFSEIVYKDALEYEFKQKGIFYERETEFPIHYKGIILPHSYFADFVVEKNIILEVKCKSQIIEKHYAQTINYLKASKLTIGLIVNFFESSLQHKRVIYTK